MKNDSRIKSELLLATEDKMLGSIALSPMKMTY